MAKCKICEHKLEGKPILVLPDMPSAAQHLPDNNTINNDKSVKMEIYQCDNCGLVQLQAPPVSYFREVIRASGVSSEMQTFRKKQFEEFVKTHNCKKIIEIGCGSGEYLSIMNQICEESYGIEYNDNNVEKCKKQNLNVSKLYLENESEIIPKAPFDSFFILNYLEHIPNIKSFLIGLRNNLAENATGLVEVPNFDMMLKESLFAEFIPDHLYYFTKETLSFTLMSCGFEVLSIDTVWHNYIISAVVRKRKKIDTSEFELAIDKLTNELNSYIDTYKDVSVWGAGHQAFALLSIAKLGKKIKYIVDSADFKQNKLSPATHIPIVSPQYFRENPTLSIIVMAGSYSNEVVNTIKEFNIPNINIAVMDGNVLKSVQGV